MQTTDVTPDSQGWETQYREQPDWWAKERPSYDIWDTWVAEHPDLDGGVLGRATTERAAKQDAIRRHIYNR